MADDNDKKVSAEAEKQAAAEETQSSGQKAEPSTEKEAPEDFPVVGVGASAGGLDALKELFGAMPSDMGAAFVVISHQSPEHVSMLPQLLEKTTDMPVVEVRDGQKLEPDHVYISRGTPLAVEQNVLREKPSEDRRVPPLPVDLFFRSLADDRGHLAICIVLSGTGADGSVGLKAVKGAGGMAMVQEAKTARYAGMPSSAIATSQADYILSPPEMPAHLKAYCGNLTVPKMPRETDEVAASAPLREIFRLLRLRVGHDFSDYKLSTLRRRIERRMNVHQLDRLEDYARLLQKNPQEIEVLFREFLIGVTRFFRDPEAYRALVEGPLSGLMEEKEEGAPLRAWIVGCGTGEEAYSIAILVREQAEALGKMFDFQIFATDLDHASIQTARTGRYPPGIANDIAADKLQHYFVKEETSYRISKEIRDMVIFAPQDVTSDPPFTRLDLLSCRNVLIYMNTSLQKRVLPVFHYALRSGGLLFLGPSETVGAQEDLFESVDRQHKVFRRREVPSNLPQLPTLAGRTGHAAAVGAEPPAEGEDLMHRRQRLSALAEKMLINRFVPPAVLTNLKGEVFYIHGRTGNYLEPASGEPPGNVVEMAREGLRERLETALHQAASEDSPVRRRVRVRTNGEWDNVDLVAVKLGEPGSLRDMLLITFRSVAPPPPKPDEGSEAREADETDDQEQSWKDKRIAKLEEQLRNTKESLQITVEELETSNEELKSANEELQSTNEELQSANEELETSKEEMQSLNEELTTVNSELESKVEDLAEANSDMRNLLNSTDIATVFLDRELRIKRFTNKARDVVSLIDTDTGRPIGDLSTNVTGVDLEQKASQVLESLSAVEQEVQTEDGTWYLLRMCPYRTVENVIDGVVVTFVEINHLKNLVKEGQNAWEFYESIFDTLREPVLILDGNLTVITANERFYRSFRISPKHTEDKKLEDLGKGQWDLSDLVALLNSVLAENSAFQDYELEADFGRAGRHKLLLNGLKIERAVGRPEMILLAMEPLDGGQ